MNKPVKISSDSKRSWITKRSIISNNKPSKKKNLAISMSIKNLKIY